MNITRFVFDHVVELLSDPMSCVVADISDPLSFVVAEINIFSTFTFLLFIFVFGAFSVVVWLVFDSIN